MRVIALEEHFSAPAIAARIDRNLLVGRVAPRRVAPGRANPIELAPDVGDARLRAIDEFGITMQVLSNTGPGPDLLPGTEGVDLARALNDHLAEAVARHPDRLAGFAVLPMRSPDAAAAELERSVTELGFVGALINGTTDGRFLGQPDHPRSGLDHHQRHFHRAAVSRRAADVWHRPDHVFR
jgi:predicted TIM-barrel fold metal-dependent hydrolase